MYGSCSGDNGVGNSKELPSSYYLCLSQKGVQRNYEDETNPKYRNKSQFNKHQNKAVGISHMNHTNPYQTTKCGDAVVLLLLF